jgi:hypothetical protein
MVWLQITFGFVVISLSILLVGYFATLILKLVVRSGSPVLPVGTGIIGAITLVTLLLFVRTVFLELNYLGTQMP